MALITGLAIYRISKLGKAAVGAVIGDLDTSLKCEDDNLSAIGLQLADLLSHQSKVEWKEEATPWIRDACKVIARRHVYLWKKREEEKNKAKRKKRSDAEDFDEEDEEDGKSIPKRIKTAEGNGSARIRSHNTDVQSDTPPKTTAKNSRKRGVNTDIKDTEAEGTAAKRKKSGYPVKNSGRIRAHNSTTYVSNDTDPFANSILVLPWNMQSWAVCMIPDGSHLDTPGLEWEQISLMAIVKDEQVLHNAGELNSRWLDFHKFKSILAACGADWVVGVSSRLLYRGLDGDEMVDDEFDFADGVARWIKGMREGAEVNRFWGVRKIVQ